MTFLDEFSIKIKKRWSSILFLNKLILETKSTVLFLQLRLRPLTIPYWLFWLPEYKVADLPLAFGGNLIINEPGCVYLSGCVALLLRCSQCWVAATAAMWWCGPPLLLHPLLLSGASPTICKASTPAYHLLRSILFKNFWNIKIAFRTKH